jgi:beta-barrel assembly-enhancing protease
MKPLCNAILVVVVALSLAVPAGFAAPQQAQPQAPAQPQTQDQQPAAAVQSATTDKSQQPQAQDQPATASQPATAGDQQTTSSDDEGKAPTNVKSGSKKDVNSIGNRGVGKGVNLYSLEREIALGKGAAMEVEKSSRLITDPVVTEYVNRIGQNLVRNSDAKVPFTIKVIDSDEVNAMALPGGFFYVNTGLILRADEEAELAGVMGHEIAHVAARHGTKNATKGEIAQLATIPLILLGPGGWAGYGLYEGLNLAIPLGFLKFSRDDEREADYLGLQYMYKAGYDPNAFVSIFEKLEAEERRHPGSIPKVFSTHPPTPERIQKAQEEIATILPARDEYIVTTSEFDIVKERLRKIENKNKLDNSKSTDKPTLRTRTEQQPQDKTDKQQPQTGDDSDPDRPVLKKRTDDGTN